VPKKLSKVQVQDVIVISDTHIGCKMALMDRGGVHLDENNIVAPNRLQLKLCDFWEELWGEWVPRVTQHRPFYVVHNGDVIDGVHHNATTQWSHNLHDQRHHAVNILRPVVELCEGRYFQVRGTEAHVGRSASDEESLANELKAIPDQDGKRSRWELWLRLGESGPLCHFLHHIGTTSSGQHETSALNAEIAAVYLECGKNHLEPPTFIVRSHRHRSCEVSLPVNRAGVTGCVTCFVTPAWQLKTGYAWKIAGARNTTPQIGASLIHYETGGKWGTEHYVRNIERSKVEVV
jgi:hypothetical protein